MALGRVRRCGTRRWRDWMIARRILILCAVLVVLCFALGSLCDDVYAERDRSLLTQKGLSRGKLNEGKGVPPTTTQKAIGIGAVVVMIVVVKWL